jgi:hypothetical protein
MDPTVVTIVVAVLSVLASGGLSLYITYRFWRWQYEDSRPKLEIEHGIKGPKNNHYSVHIWNRNEKWNVYNVTVAAQLIIPKNNDTDDILGIPIEAGATNNFNHIPALGPTGSRQRNSEEAPDNRGVVLYFDDLPDPSDRLPAPYAGVDQNERAVWTGDPTQVKDLLEHGNPNFTGARKPAVWIYVDGYDERTNARQFLKQAYDVDDFTNAHQA